MIAAFELVKLPVGAIRTDNPVSFGYHPVNDTSGNIIKLHVTPGEEALETFTPGVDPGTVPHSSGRTGQVD